MVDVEVQGVRNRLLRALPLAELSMVLPRMRRDQVAFGEVLFLPGDILDTVNFIEAGVVSMLANLEDGSQVEVGLIGREGFTGLQVLTGRGVASLEGRMQSDGQLLRLPSPALPAILAQAPTLSALMLRSAGSFMAHLAQCAACQAHHTVEQRLARWLLTMQDRVEADQFRMTQELMSQMLGVQRPSVTIAAGVLQRQGLIRLGRGVVQVLDRAALEEVACECHAQVRQHFAWLQDLPDEVG